jgi:hypothetical protein
MHGVARRISMGWLLKVGWKIQSVWDSSVIRSLANMPLR